MLSLLPPDIDSDPVVTNKRVMRACDELLLEFLLVCWVFRVVNFVQVLYRAFSRRLNNKLSLFVYNSGETSNFLFVDISDDACMHSP